ncbi:hypothetical protein LEP1GSC203_1096 [Leptospira terpstrae serovar Hualin str. LT 11-33 = ATCC 700639]|uniref:Uncharacterized protein n=2 Tax=Leptospira TaxID=171 RepID=N1VNI4_9LEPT|nr:hypothetical protein LEP1GSC203_1096 [Leptospira terpstrae serovar Hualin str. LT 11-33 = ATCC 700639]
MSKNIGYIELSNAPQNKVNTKKFKHCNVYPQIIQNALVDFKQTTGKNSFKNIDLEISGLLLIPCVNIYYE